MKPSTIPVPWPWGPCGGDLRKYWSKRGIKTEGLDPLDDVRSWPGRAAQSRLLQPTAATASSEKYCVKDLVNDLFSDVPDESDPDEV